MHGEGTGVQHSEHARALFAAAFAEAQLTVQVHGGLTLFVSAQPQVALLRRRFRLEGAGVVHQPATLAFNAAVGLGYDFSFKP